MDCPTVPTDTGKIELVIFDLDGTLVDAYAAVASSLNHTLRKMGRPSADDGRIKRAVGRGDRSLIATFMSDDQVDEALIIFRGHHAAALPRDTHFLPGAGELLARLKDKGYKLAIASNRPTKFSLIILKHLGSLDMFDHVICADKVANPKPKADILLNVLQELKTDRSRAIYVGDMDIDILTGKNAGVRTIAVTTGSCTSEELSTLGPLRIIDHVGEVEEIIDGLAR